MVEIIIIRCEDSFIESNFDMRFLFEDSSVRNKMFVCQEKIGHVKVDNIEFAKRSTRAKDVSSPRRLYKIPYNTYYIFYDNKDQLQNDSIII